jgi:predicted metal-dependent peptidase
LRPPERCFVLAHETYHAVWRHSPRIKYYLREGNIDGVPFDRDIFNFAADFVINADLIDLKIGLCNPEWLYDPAIKGTDKIEEVYKKLYAEMPKRPRKPRGPGEAEPCEDGEGGTTGSKPPKTYKRGSQPDKEAQKQGGRFDEVTEPHVDPKTGQESQIDEITFKESIARAAMAAKSVGKMPGNFQRIVDEILAPQVDWKERVRLKITGKIGNRKENWATPNRRRIVMDPMVYMPGKRGFGAELVAVWIDSSGSVGDREYNAFFGEVGGIMQDIRPKRLLVGWCDAIVQGTEWCTHLDDVHDLHRKPIPGRGGTSFIPPFEWMKVEGLVPDVLVYLTDGYGPFPKDPGYPTIWVMSTDIKAPFGETVKIVP